MGRRGQIIWKYIVLSLKSSILCFISWKHFISIRRCERLHINVPTLVFKYSSNLGYLYFPFVPRHLQEPGFSLPYYSSVSSPVFLSCSLAITTLSLSYQINIVSQKSPLCQCPSTFTYPDMFSQCINQHFIRSYSGPIRKPLWIYEWLLL